MKYSKLCIFIICLSFTLSDKDMSAGCYVPIGQMKHLHLSCYDA